MQSYEVERFAYGINSTLSRFWNITDGGRIPLCWVLEDERRETKVFKETCIPAGTYVLQLRTTGGFHTKYLKRFPEFHIGMIEVMNVPDFQWILHHCGNSHKHTGGCSLYGDMPVIIPEGGADFEVARSEVAYRRVYPIISGPLAEGERSTITYLERQPYG